MIRNLALAAALFGSATAHEPKQTVSFTAEITDTRSATDKWTEFKEKFGKVYSSTKEELHRFGIFVHNMETAARSQAMDMGSAKYGHLTKFADWTQEEFARLNTLKAQDIDQILSSAKKAPKLPLTDDSSFDWRDKGNIVNEPKDQGQCGSCWTFATVANIEGVNALATGELLSLSEQEIVDCSDSDDGCNGGLPSRAYQDMINEGWGLETEDEYGYHAVQGSCKKDKSEEKVFIDSWQQISEDEDQIAAALVKYGPLAIGVNANPLQMYMGGILDPWFCSPMGIDHAVTLIGYGSEGGKQYWIIRNSWGATWGEEGYYRMVRGKGKCGMNRMVTTALMSSETAAKNKRAISKSRAYKRSTKTGGEEVIFGTSKKTFLKKDALPSLNDILNGKLEGVFGQ